MLVHQYLLAASAAVLVSAQNPPRQGPILGCTTSSFAIPSWFVQDFQFAGSTSSPASGNASFHIINRATNYTAGLVCQVGSGSWNDCSLQGKPLSNETLRALIQIKGESAQVSLNQTWTCNDRKSHSLTFTAVGNNSIPLACTGKTCAAVNSLSLVKGSLLSPVAITPVYAKGPTGHGTAGCSAAGKNPSWTLSAIYYVNQRGDGVSSTPSQNFVLQVVNPSIGYQASCMAGVIPDSVASSGIGTRLTCAGHEFGAQGTDRYHLETEALFDPATFRFTMNQTWYCDAADPAKPLKITATGSQILPLNCTNAAVDGAPNGTTTSCGINGDVILKGSVLQEEVLPPYSIDDPLPLPDGCTLSSIFSPRWTFSAFEVDHNASVAVANDGSTSSVSFNLILQTANPGFQFPISISQDARVGNSSWFKCAIGEAGGEGQILWPSECSFQYRPLTKELALKADWICSDLDAEHPVAFSGVTTTAVNSPLACSTVDGVSQCLTTDTGYTWTAGISNVTWHSASL